MITGLIEKLAVLREQKYWSLLFRGCVVVLICCLLCSCSIETAMSQIKTPSFWKPQLTDCWPCAVYGSVFTKLSEIISEGVKLVSAVCITFLPIFLGLFLVSKIGGVVLNPAETYPKAMRALAYALIKAMLIALLLSNYAMFSELFMGYILQPVSNMFLGIANILLDSGPITATTLNLQAFDSSIDTTAIWDGSKNIQISSDIFGTLPFQLQELVFRIYRSLRAGVAIGVYIWDSVSQVSQTFALIVSLFIIFYSFELSVVLPYTFIEALLRLGIAFLLLPILLVCWVFEGSSKLIPQLKSVVPLALAAFIDIVFACAFVVVMTTTLQVYTDAALDQFWSKGTSDENLAVVAQSEYVYINMLILVVLMLAFTKLAEKIQEISKIYTGGVASSAGTMRNKVKKTLQGVGKTFLGLVTGKWGLLWEGLKQGSTEIFRNN